MPATAGTTTDSVTVAGLSCCSATTATNAGADVATTAGELTGVGANATVCTATAALFATLDTTLVTVFTTTGLATLSLTTGVVGDTGCCGVFNAGAMTLASAPVSMVFMLLV